MSAHNHTPSRGQVLEWALQILLDGQERTGREIAAELYKQGLQVDKRLVNSVLFSEGRSRVIYNTEKFTYHIKGLEEEARKPSGPPIQSDVVPLQATLERFARRYTFGVERAGAEAFFRAEVKGGKVAILFNEIHPFYSLLKDLVEKDTSMNGTSSVLTETFLECLKVLLQGWAILENEEPSPKRIQLLQDVRLDWSRKVRELIDEQ